MRLSVIVPCYSRHELSARHVAECLKSTRLPDEIIVVNDGGPDNLRDLLEPLRGPVPIVYAKVEEDILWNYNGACNLGLWLSTGDVIALEDTDHIPTKTAYERGLKALEDHPDYDRVSFDRHIVQITDMDKPMEDWVSTGHMGANQMVGMMRRDAWLRLKGQDERMCGHYGYMAYDLPYRRDKLLKVQTVKESFYWAVLGDGGEPNLKRGLSKHNRHIYHQNVNAGKLHSMHGILNFHFTMERL